MKKIKLITALIMASLFAVNISANPVPADSVQNETDADAYEAADEPMEASWSGLLLSVRTEMLTVLSEVTTVGLTAEIGLIDDNGFLVSADLTAGANYWGVGVNAGYVLPVYGNLKNIVGFSCGYRNTALVVNVESAAGHWLRRYCGNNYAIAGLFWKAMPWWETENLDVTNKFLFGYKKDSARYDKANDEIDFKSGLSMTYSLSVGYTLIRRSR